MFAIDRLLRPLGAVTLLATAILGGCAQPRPVTPEPDEIPNRRFPNVTLIRIREDQMAADEPIVTPARDGGPMSVRVPIRSLVERTIEAEYRFLFYTENMDLVTMSPSWREVIFAPLQRHVLQANSVSDRAAKWTLEVRRR